MPVYEFECEKCHKIIEKITIKLKPDIITCDCGGVAKRIISGFNFILVGSGWSKDGYEKKNIN